MKKIFLSFVSGMAAVAAQAQISLPMHTQHTYFDFKGAVQGSMMEVDLNWETQPGPGWGSYAMFWAYFQSGTGAYMGLQNDDRDGKKIIFSFWDPSSSLKVRPYALPHCKRFDHEATGGQCIMKFLWKSGTKYKLVMGVIPAKAGDSGFVRWGGWLVDTSTGAETFIGGYEVPNYNGMQGVGFIQPSLSNVTYEYYGAPAGATCASMPATSLTWSGLRINGSVAPSNAYPRYNTGVGGDCQFTMNVRQYSKGADSVTQTTNVPNITKVAEGTRMWGSSSVTPVTPVPVTPVPTQPVVPTPAPTAPVEQLPQQSLDRVQCTFEAIYKYFPQFFGSRAPFIDRTSNSIYMHYTWEYAKANSQVYEVSYDDKEIRTLRVWYSNGQLVDLGPMGDWIALAGC
jgi:hypothetical protein